MFTQRSAAESRAFQETASGVPSSQNPFLFLVGCPRSGTTLLTRILDAHPRLAMINREQHWIPRFFLKRIGVNENGTVTPDLITELLSDPKFIKLGFDRERLETFLSEDHETSYAEFVRNFFDAYGKSENKDLVGEKTPGNDLHIPILHSLWPEARIVHLIRDGRDVALSAINWKKAERLKTRFRVWQENPVIGAAYWWRWHVESGRTAGSALGRSLYYEVRYEDLVRNPTQACSDLCSFLGLNYSARMPSFHEGKSKPGEGRDAKHAWIGITPGLRDWRRDMSPDDVELFESAARETLNQCGYELSFSSIRAEIADRVRPLKSIFAEDATSKIRSVPEGW